MHGLIHCTLKQMLAAHGGERAWMEAYDRTRKDFGVADTQVIVLLELKQYPDAITESFMRNTFAVLDVTFGEGLQLLGKEHIRYAAENGYLVLLKGMGTSLEQLLHNLNNLHSNLERSFRKAALPMFSVTPVSAGCFDLAYQSSRVGLAKVVEGVLPELGQRLFGERVTLAASTPAPGYSHAWRVTVTKSLVAAVLPKRAGSFSDLHEALVSLVFGGSTSSTVEEFVHDAASPKKALPRGDRDQLFRELDVVHAQVKHMKAPALKLMRGVSPAWVAADWSEPDMLQAIADFWASPVGRLEDYALSETPRTGTRFVSHVWTPPADWKERIGQQMTYAQAKTMELNLAVKDHASKNHMDPKDVRLWIDKCCCPQEHPLLRVYVQLIQDFIRHCEGLVVLLSWHYFERMWWCDAAPYGRFRSPRLRALLPACTAPVACWSGPASCSTTRRATCACARRCSCATPPSRSTWTPCATSRS